MNGYVESIKHPRRRWWIVTAAIGNQRVEVKAKSLRRAKRMLALHGADWIVK